MSAMIAAMSHSSYTHDNRQQDTDKIKDIEVGFGAEYALDDIINVSQPRANTDGVEEVGVANIYGLGNDHQAEHVPRFGGSDVSFSIRGTNSIRTPTD